VEETNALTLGEGEITIYRKSQSMLNIPLAVQLKNVTLAALDVFQLYFTAYFSVRIKANVTP